MEHSYRVSVGAWETLLFRNNCQLMATFNTTRILRDLTDYLLQISKIYKCTFDSEMFRIRYFICNYASENYGIPAFMVSALCAVLPKMCPFY